MVKKIVMLYFGSIFLLYLYDNEYIDKICYLSINIFKFKKNIKFFFLFYISK